MPALKKKGAIFAIYTDSPVASSSLPAKPEGSPTKRSSPRIKRKVLSSIQASAATKRTALDGGKADAKSKLIIFDDKLAVGPTKPVLARKVTSSSKVSDKENTAPAASGKTAPRATLRSPVNKACVTQGTGAVKSIKKGTLVAKTVPGSKGGKRYEVEWDADPILGDVSAVYGADPSAEPAGFKDLPTPERRSRRRSTVSSTHKSLAIAAAASSPTKHAGVKAC